MDFRTITPDEQDYLYSQSNELDMRCGCVGHLRGDFDSTSKGFFTTWFDHVASLKTDDFKAEIDDVINTLRKDGCVLHNRSDMAAYCQNNSGGSLKGSCGSKYGFRADTKTYAYLIRCFPQTGYYNFYVYCYKREWLDANLKRAATGISFIDSNYKELFRIPDGGSIIVTHKNGETNEMKCRFIDEYHTEINGRCYHICQFAERMEQNGWTYTTDNPLLPKTCFSVLPSSGEVIIINRGESGYQQTNKKINSFEEGRMIAGQLNENRGVSKAQEAAMLAGSMFGWDVPAANPNNYDKDGCPVPPKKKEHTR